MATGAISAQFRTVWIADQAGTLTEVSQYVRKAGMKLTYSPTDQTTLATGGGWVTDKITKGSLDADFTVEFTFDPTLIDLLMRIKLKSDGVLIQCREALVLNTAPTVGDDVFQGTFTLFDITAPQYKKHQLVTIVPDFKTTDAGAVVPGWFTL